MNNSEFFGRDGTIMGVGVVEDRHDPSKMGRVKVRWLGYHTDDKIKIPTKDLPWSQCMMPVGGHSISGVGESNPGIETGTWVVGFARDVDLMQDWIVLGTLPGKNVLPSQGEDEILKGDGVKGSWGKSRDTDKKGFYDPTFQSGSITQNQYLNELPFPPSRTSFISNEGGSITPTADYLEPHANWGDGAVDRMKMYGDEIIYGTAVSYTKARHAALDLPVGTTKSFSNITHTDALYETFGTTRRLVGPPTDSPNFWNQTGFTDNVNSVNLGHVISTGYYDGEDMTYPIISEVGINHRTPYPRLEYCQKKSINDLYGPSMYNRIKALYDDGVVGDKVGGKRKFKDVKASERVAIPVDDVNRLAKGGLKITGISASTPITVTTAGGSSYEPVVNNDVVTISGVKGMQELNGRRFRVKATGNPMVGYTLVLNSSDGSCIGGPGTMTSNAPLTIYSANVKTNPQATTADWTYPVGAPKFSEYLGGGAVFLDAHVSLETRAETREKWINMGHGMFVPGGKDAFAGGQRTQEIMTHYWSEPTSANAAIYPFNHVYESESGHIMEYDDTPGAERINQMHRSGTYYEIDDSGNKTTKVTGDNHNLTIHDDYLYVKGQILWTGDDEMMIRCNDQMTLGAKWNIRLVSDHNIDIHAKGDLNLRGHNVNIEARENSINMSAAKITAKAHGYASDTEPGTGYNKMGGEDEPFGGLIHLEAGAFGASSGRIVLKVPEGDPFADMAFGSDFAGNIQLPGGAIVHEGGATVDITDSPKSRNTLQARVNFAFKAADSVTAKLPGTYSNSEGDIGAWGALSDATHVGSDAMTGGSVSGFTLDKPQNNPFAGSTKPEVNVNAEKVRDLHDEVID